MCWSIRWRLTLWNTLALAVVLAVFSTMVYGLLSGVPAGPHSPGADVATPSPDRGDHRGAPGPPATRHQRARRTRPAGPDDQRHDRPARALLRRGPPLHRGRLARAADAVDRH